MKLEILNSTTRTNRNYINNLWFLHKDLWQILQRLFTRKKWKTRVDEVADGFF